MKTDPILDEIHRIRDNHARKFNNDLAAMASDHRQFSVQLKKEGWKFTKLPRRRRARVQPVE